MAGKKTPTKPAATKAAGNGAGDGSADYWGKVLEGMGASGGGSSFIFPKDGKTRVRLIRLPKEPFFAEVPVTYRGKTKNKYLVLAFRPEDAANEDFEDQLVRGLMLPKTGWKAVVGHLTEGYDFFGPEGHGITITRSGQGRETNYAIIPSKDSVEIPQRVKDEVKKSGITLKKLAAEYAKMEKDRAAGSPEGGDEIEDEVAGGAEEGEGW